MDKVMTTVKKLFANVGSRVFVIVTASLMVFFLVANILACGVFYDIICQALGRQRPIFADSSAKYTLDEGITDKASARKNAESVNEEITAEGMALLKNKNNALPLNKGAKISVFGKNSANIVTGGSGSAAGKAEYIKSLYVGLEAAGFVLNPTLKSFYEDNSKSGKGRPDSPSLSEGSAGGELLSTGETPQSMYNDTVKGSYGDYKDAAIIVFSRLGGESWDLPRSMKGMDGARADDDHYLQLDKNETDLLKDVCGRNFGKVIVLLNCSTSMELGFLDDPTHYAYSDKIDACIWMGVPGDTGIYSLGKILDGDVNPSGRLPDTYARDFKKDPTWQNFGNNNVAKGNQYAKKTGMNSAYNYAFVDYEEGIYVGYKYYETRAKEYKGAIAAIGETAEADGEAWYKKAVVFPFGYGNSYTTFTQAIDGTKPSSLTLDTKGNGTLEVSVKVTNTGDKAGKEAVQIYATAPYTSGGIEKAYVSLVGFAKTGLIQPKASETVKVTIDLYDLASYDYNDRNGNGFKGYELEAGSYVFRLMKNSHEEIENFTATLAAGFKYEKDPVTEGEIKNRFEDAAKELKTVLSRANFEGTFPATRTDAEKVLSDEGLTAINDVKHNNPSPNGKKPTVGAKGDGTLEFKDLAGLPYDDPKWDKLLDLITFEEMKTLINSGAFKTAKIDSVNKAETVDADGPAGFADFVGIEGVSPIFGVSHYCCEPLMAATFNAPLLEKLGKAVGNEALIGNSKGGEKGMPYSGWYAPGVNLHRSPFGGRTGEYFSEDGILSGVLAAYEIKGAMSKGVYTMVKHFAVNEQETTRSGVCTWLDEQTLREVYLRPFEKTVKLGGTRGMMSSFNRVGYKWTGGDYRLLTSVLRKEWGFRGTVISDYNTSSYMNNKQAAYAGGDLGLNGPGTEWVPSQGSSSDLIALRQCTKNILYTTVNSNLLNVTVIGYGLPVWQILLIVFDVLLVVGLGVWGFFAVRKALKAEPAKEEAKA